MAATRTPFPKGSGEELGGSPELNQEPIKMAPIPPYEYPAEKPKEQREPVQVQPYQRPPEPPRTGVPVPPARPRFIERAPAPVPAPMLIGHPETVTLPPTQEQPKLAPEQPKRIPETIPEQEQKEFPEQFGNNSPNNSDGNSLAPTEQAPQADSGGYKKKGRVGRQRKYEEPGNNGEIPVKKVVLFRHIKGRHWPGMSQDMQEWYERYYFTKPKKTGKGADHARHVRSHERGQRWIAEHEGREYQPGTVGHSGKVLAYRKRATS